MKPREIVLVVVGILLVMGGVGLVSGAGSESHLRGPVVAVLLLGPIVLIVAGYMWLERRGS